MIEYIFMAIAVVIIIALLHFFVNLQKRSSSRSLSKTKANAKKVFKNANSTSNTSDFLQSSCPLCKTPLLKGEDIFSKVFRPMTVSDQRCIIMGCPHCYPTRKNGIERRCPVCHKTVPEDGHLVSRLFNKTKDGKKHVVVTGCSVCCKYEKP
ncbi:MAG: hypothetical protein IKI31_03405 [Treponema sp.]|nr:hypothetical protein [Treponema sp.]